MNAKLALTSLAIAGTMALATPGFAQDRSYGEGMRPGSLGMDVAPGGGTYTRQDVANEPADRMSHPVPGERRAPSNVAHGSLARVDSAEEAQTARLNQQQLNGSEMTATLPDQDQDHPDRMMRHRDRTMQHRDRMMQDRDQDE